MLEHPAVAKLQNKKKRKKVDRVNVKRSRLHYHGYCKSHNLQDPVWLRSGGILESSGKSVLEVLQCEEDLKLIAKG